MIFHKFIATDGWYCRYKNINNDNWKFRGIGSDRMVGVERRKL